MLLGAAVRGPYHAAMDLKINPGPVVPESEISQAYSRATGLQKDARAQVTGP